MWNEARKKVKRLKSLDVQFEIFGSEKHKYRLNPPLQEEQLVKVENAIGVTLPDALRGYYLQMGNGDAGPYSAYFLQRAWPTN